VPSDGSDGTVSVSSECAAALGELLWGRRQTSVLTMDEHLVLRLQVEWERQLQVMHCGSRVRSRSWRLRM
jgi:hypothetical protein